MYGSTDKNVLRTERPFKESCPRRFLRNKPGMAAIFIVVALLTVVIVLAVVLRNAHANTPSPPPAPIHETLRRYLEAALTNVTGMMRLQYMCDSFGHRLSGSASLEAALNWTAQQMLADGFNNVTMEWCPVTNWVRGIEYATLLAPEFIGPRNLPMLGLGGSVGTNGQPLIAQVLVVTSFADLASRHDDVPGKIVVFNVPYTTYGETVQYRSIGAQRAQALGAVGMLVRSVTPVSLQSPHTGGMNATGVTIPAAAITVEDAELMGRLQGMGREITVELFMSAETRPPAMSKNVVGELTGYEFPDEYVVLGGHIDSWDVGQGAHDDAGGVVASWEAIRLLIDLGIRPRRSIRVVAWTNEENGQAGAQRYRELHVDEFPRHSLAMEMDLGVFQPAGIGFTGSGPASAIMTDLLKNVRFGGFSATALTPGGGGVDIAPIMACGVPGASPNMVPNDYFTYHHADADTFDKIDIRAFQQSTALLGAVALQVANLDTLLPRAPNAPTCT